MLRVVIKAIIWISWICMNTNKVIWHINNSTHTHETCQACNSPSKKTCCKQYQEKMKNTYLKLKGFLPRPAGKEVVESTLMLPIASMGFRVPLILCGAESFFPDNMLDVALPHLKGPMLWPRDILLRGWACIAAGPSTGLSLGLPTYALAFAFAETVGTM